MCLIAVFSRVVEDSPLVVGANREEIFARGGSPPTLLDGSCRAVAGLDPLAGGTWLGVNEHELLIAVTNRRKEEMPREPRSRGLLAREILCCTSADEASEKAARALAKGAYAGCNIVCADRKAAFVVQGGDWLRVRPLPPGIHVLTNCEMNDGSDRRLGYALEWLNQRHYANAEQCIKVLRDLCAQVGDPPICLRGPDRGTVSSSIIALRSPRSRNTYLHAQGSPDQTPYADFSHLLRELHLDATTGA